MREVDGFKPYASFPKPVEPNATGAKEAAGEKINALSSKIPSVSSPPPPTFLKSKAIGRWLAKMVFGSKEQRAANTELRAQLLANPKYSVEKVKFPTVDGLELSGTLVQPKDGLQEGKKTYIYCSGSFACYEEYVQDFGFRGVLKGLINDGHQVLLFDYRGFGENMIDQKNEDGGELQPSAQGIRYDTDAAYRFVKERGIEDQDIVMYGYSMGGNVAAEVAVEHNTNLVLDRVSLDTGAAAKEGVPAFLGSIAKSVIKHSFPLSVIKHLSGFKGKDLRIIIEKEGNPNEDPRVKEFKKVLAEDYHESIHEFQNMPHLFDQDHGPDYKFFEKINIS